MSRRGGSCGACKFMKRKCENGCIFAPYFSHDQSSQHFRAVNTIFGCSNVSKLLKRIPASKRGPAVATIIYEAQARVMDPVYGCVAHVYELQQKILKLQAELAFVKGKLEALSMASQGYSCGDNNGILAATRFSDAPCVYNGHSTIMNGPEFTTIFTSGGSGWGSSNITYSDVLQEDQSALSGFSTTTNCSPVPQPVESSHIITEEISQTNIKPFPNDSAEESFDL